MRANATYHSFTFLFLRLHIEYFLAFHTASQKLLSNAEVFEPVSQCYTKYITNRPKSITAISYNNTKQ